MITPSFSPTATERVLPKLALDFTTASLDSRITFTRTTDATHPATYVNSSGYVTAATNDQPRFDYNPITLACKGLLIEESRANLILQSSTFGTTWTVQPTLTSDSTVSPSNVQDADTLDVTVTGQLVQQVTTVANNALSNTISVFVKQGTAAKTAINLIYFGGTGVSYQATFNWATKTLVDDFGTATSISVTPYANGFYRITLSGANNNTGNTGLNFRIYPAGHPSYGGGTGNIVMWGAQVEAGAFPTSYIPTTTTALTRNADIATMTGQGVAAQGTFTVDATVISGKTLITSGSVTFAATASTAQKTAVAYDVTSINKSINAATVTTGSGATASTTIDIGPNSDGYFRKMAFYLPKLINAELQAFTK